MECCAMPPESHVVLSADRVYRQFSRGSVAVNAVRGVSLSVAAGEIIALMGPSGCGKTSLLHLLGGLDAADSGAITVDGIDWASLSSRERADVRRRRFGFVFQSLALLPMATAFENVDTPLLLDGRKPVDRVKQVTEMLERVGLGPKANQYPDQLSGGELQRVAIARALVHDPAVVLADEPTGSLDSVTAQQITDLLVDSARARGAAVVLVTHDERVGAHADRVLRLDSGRITTDQPAQIMGER
jgi:putative ABC transport system ATP-binding protein